MSSTFFTFCMFFYTFFYKEAIFSTFSSSFCPRPLFRHSEWAIAPKNPRLAAFIFVQSPKKLMVLDSSLLSEWRRMGHPLVMLNLIQHPHGPRIALRLSGATGVAGRHSEWAVAPKNPRLSAFVFGQSPKNSMFLDPSLRSGWRKKRGVEWRQK